MIELHSLSGLSGLFLSSVSGLGADGGGVASNGGPYGQLQSHGVKCVINVRHSVSPAEYVSAN